MKVSIGDITTAIQYGFTESATSVPLGPKFLRITDIQDGEVNWDSVPYCKCNDVEKYRLKKGDLVFARTGATTGKSYLIGECPEAVFASYLIRLRVKENVCPNYVYYFFQSELYWLKIRSGITGSTQGGLNATKLSEFEVDLPEYKLQVEIAEQLEQADKARQQRKEANALTDQFLQSSFLSLFGDPVKNEKGWEVKKIRDFTPSILAGKSIESESRLKNDNEYGVLKVSAVTYGVFKPEEHKAIVNGYVPDNKITPKKGDILFSRANTKELVAATCIVDKDYPDLFLPDKLWKINIDRTVINEWFFKFVLSQQSYRNKLSEKSTGTSGSMFNISKEKLIEFNFPVPPLSLQQQFAAIVAQAETLRKKQQENEQELEQLFQALLQKYFG